MWVNVALRQQEALNGGITECKSFNAAPGEYVCDAGVGVGEAHKVNR